MTKVSKTLGRPTSIKTRLILRQGEEASNPVGATKAR